MSNSAETTGQKGRIVVGMDGAPGSVAALRWAVAEARLRGATVEAVVAWSPPRTQSTTPGFTREDFQADATAAQRKAIDNVRDDLEGVEIVLTATEG